MDNQAGNNNFQQILSSSETILKEVNRLIYLLRYSTINHESDC